MSGAVPLRSAACVFAALPRRCLLGKPPDPLLLPALAFQVRATPAALCPRLWTA